MTKLEEIVTKAGFYLSNCAKCGQRYADFTPRTAPYLCGYCTIQKRKEAQSKAVQPVHEFMPIGKDHR
jgi:hypothetical protein